MTEIGEFGESAQDLVNNLIGRPFPDAIPVLESWFDGLTHKQLVFFEQYWRENGPRDASAREHWEALRRARERPLKVKQRRFRKETVVIFGHRISVLRDTLTGRFVRRRRG